eukprot:CAMPEP_0182473786 /NCGR_PEP_ID=MMETSP1319-20130603/24564_1 /TAXON_ID=172717 /ORGANISM="Bolidomonas pacifica, Strain RCC208" /LENGTH=369 /DNA_ID=CAMNT_0024674621 /DNA_START=318 /DNA_END=1424 /DNA_ORIENTATION=-
MPPSDHLSSPPPPPPPPPLDYEGRISEEYNPETFRSGFVSIVGAPNMGKSTLLNKLLDEDLCITTPRPQTTRHAILAVLTSEEHETQLAFLDTPGVISKTRYKLQDTMMEAVQGSLHSSEVILVLTDVFSTVPFSEDDKILQKLKRTKQNIVVVVNKIDLLDKVTNFTASDADDDGGDALGTRTTSVPEAVAKWRSILPNAVAIIPISCKTGQNIPTLRKLLLAEPDVPAAFRSLGRPVPGTFRAGESTVTDEMARSLLPVSPPLYSFSTLTDRSERFFASEIIRAVLFGKFKKEVPYSCEVAVTGFTELEPGSKEKVRRLSASIMVERESQKGILVGKGGVMVKEVGVGSRKRLEEFFQERIHLDLSV